MSQDVNEACNTCRYFDAEGNQYPLGCPVCKRHAPVADPRVSMCGHYPIWPMTHAFEWCGDWEEDK